MTTTLTFVQILAMTMFGEAAILNNPEAAMAVGHVFMNRWDYGIAATPEELAKGFAGFAVTRLEDVPEDYFHIAYVAYELVCDERQLAYDLANNVPPDITNGSLFIWSYQDIERHITKPYIQFLKDNAEWSSEPVVLHDGKPYALYTFRRYPIDIVAKEVERDWLQGSDRDSGSGQHPEIQSEGVSMDSDHTGDIDSMVVVRSDIP